VTRHVRRGGTYHRVADPAWTDPLDASYSARHGGRWNPPGLGALYLNRTVATARANARHMLTTRLAPLAATVDDLDPAELPVLVSVDLPADSYVDAVTERGLRALGLPATYPSHPGGHPVGHGQCQPIGAELAAAGEPGIACRSSAPSAPPGAEELAVYDTITGPAAGRRVFADWYGTVDF